MEIVNITDIDTVQAKYSCDTCDKGLTFDEYYNLAIDAVIKAITAARSVSR